MQVENRPLDAEFVSLIHEVFKKEIPAYLWRGYAILDKDKGCLIEKTQVAHILHLHGILISAINSPINVKRANEIFPKLEIVSNLVVR